MLPTFRIFPFVNLFLNKADRVRYLGFDDRPLVLLGIFPLAALSNAFFDGWNPVLTPRQMLSCYALSILFTTIYWVASRYVLLTFRRLMPQRERTLRRVAVTLFTLLGVTLIISFFADSIMRSFGLGDANRDIPFVMKTLIAYTLVVMVTAIYESKFFFVQYQRTELAREQLAKQHVKAELAVLRQQMNPHFLFNSLNTLTHLIPEDGPKAVIFTQRLAAVYRRILDYRQRDTIRLDEELAALRDYLYLMHARFEDKLRVRWEVIKQGARPPVQGEFSGAERGHTEPRPPAHSPPGGRGARAGGRGSGNYRGAEGSATPKPPPVAFPAHRPAGNGTTQPEDTAADVLTIPQQDHQSIPPELPADLAARHLVPLAAQLLVENALKHNVVSTAHPLVITIRLTPDDLTVHHPLRRRTGSGQVVSTGWGLDNLRRRYAAVTDVPILVEDTGQVFRVTIPLVA